MIPSIYIEDFQNYKKKGQFAIYQKNYTFLHVMLGTTQYSNLRISESINSGSKLIWTAWSWKWISKKNFRRHPR